MDRNSWHDSYYPEDMPQAPSQRQDRPFREPNYQQGYRPRHSEYPRDNSDYQSSATGSTFYSQPPSNYYNYTREYQPRNDSQYPRKYDRDERPQYSRDQDYNASSPPYHFDQGYRENARPYREPRYEANRDSRDSSHTRDPRYNQSANRYPQRHDTRHFDNRYPSSESSYHRPEHSSQGAHDSGPADRQQSDSKYRHYPSRYNQRNEPRYSNNSDNQNYQKEVRSPVSPRGTVDRQTSDPFYVKWRETPKPRSRCSSTSSSKEDVPRSRDECIICYGTIKILALTPCEHLYCHLCCIRLQILCEDQHCPICRTPFEENPVILLQLSIPSPVYRDLIGSCIRDCIENFKISLLRPLNRGLIDELFNFKCRVQDCPFIPPRNDKRQLERHLKSTHELYYCHVCMQGLKQFIFEMRLYSWEDLNKHKDGKGESKLDPPGHHGHPLCKFCRDRFLDDTTLYEHLHQCHFWCFICERNNTYVYYSSTEELRIHFKQEHFLCERGDCKQEVFTTAFASEIDFKAHISSVHAGDLRKNEAKNLRRVDLEFNYASTHQTDQGHRNRKQWRDRKTDQNNDRTDQLSDNEETENNNDEPATDTNQSEFNFKNEDPNQETTIEPPRTVDNKENITKPNEPPSDPVSWDDDTHAQSPIDLANIWPQIEADTVKPVSIVNVHTTTSGSELASRPADRNSALSYSQSLGIPKQSGKPFPLNPPTQSARPPAPSAYSDIVKPEAARAQKQQSQSKPKSQPQPQDPVSEATKAPLRKKTYEDVFPALCVGNSVPLQTEKQQQQQVQPTAAPSLGKAGKKSNKQRKKENITSQPLVTQPNDSPPIDFNRISYPAREKPQSAPFHPETQHKKKEITSRNPRVAPPHNDSPPLKPTPHSNDYKSSPATARDKPQPAAWPALLPDAQHKKKEMSSSRTRNAPPEPPNAILVPYAQWQPPNKYQMRKSALETHIVSSFNVNNELKQYYKNYQNLINKTLPVYEFLQYFKTTFGDRFSTIFPEMLVLLPDIGLQQELLEAKHHLYPAVAFLSLPSAISSWSKPTRIQLDTCSTCAQVFLPSDAIDHKGTHSTEDEFPALC